MVALSPEYRDSALAALAGAELDVLVVGGGVVGAGCALDAATRGLTVGLVEARDFASGTSSRSSKLIHGGLRYLEMLDFALVREALRERGLLLTRLAPHLVRPVRFLYPLQHRGWERLYAGSGVTLYDAMAMGGGLPHHRHLSLRGALRECPALKKESLVGALQYYTPRWTTRGTPCSWPGRRPRTGRMSPRGRRSWVFSGRASGSPASACTTWNTTGGSRSAPSR